MKQTVVNHCCSLLHNIHEIMSWLPKDLHDSEVLIVLKLTKLSCSCSIRIIRRYVLNRAADWEFSDPYLKSVFKKHRPIKNLVFWKKNEKQNKTKFWTFLWTCYTWNKCIMGNPTFLLILPKYSIMQYKFNNFNIGTINGIQNNLSSYTKWERKFKVRFY